jgi:CheY-like chemotaxis protein
MTDLAVETATHELSSAYAGDTDPADPAALGRGAAPPQVLVVDDDPGIRLVFARAFARAGYEVFLAASGTEALTQLDRQPDVIAVLSDLGMRGMTGLALAQKIHQRQPELPILYVSASQHAAQLANHPSIDLLTKPVTADQLIDGVAALLRHRYNHHHLATSAPSDMGTVRHATNHTPGPQSDDVGA